MEALSPRQKYLFWLIVGLVPALAGCLEHLRVKADVDVEASESAEEESTKVDPNSEPS